MKSPSQPALVLNPTSGQERYEFLDVVRGFALFGIITANMILYSLYLHLPESAKLSLKTHSTDKVLDFLELFVIEGKFYTIFSVLFGIGFSILLTRTEAKGMRFRTFFFRRVSILYLIGVGHAILLWHDDILQFYAFCGALLLPFVRLRNRAILVIAAIALLTPAVLKFTGAMPQGTFTAPRDMLFDSFGFTRDTRIAVWTGGSTADILRLNFASWFSQLDTVITSGMIFKIFGCFLLGFYLGRNEIYKNLERYRPIIKRLAIYGFLVGIPLNAIYASTFETESWLQIMSSTLGILPLSAAYVSLLALIWMSGTGHRLLGLFAPVGRMALTNYVGQSLICTMIFYGTGLGLGGTMGPSSYLPIGVAVYLLQVGVSHAWLGRFRFGPLEWIWRMLTYGIRIRLAKGT